MNLGRKVGERLQGEAAGDWAFYQLRLGAKPSLGLEGWGEVPFTWGLMGFDSFYWRGEFF